MKLNLFLDDFQEIISHKISDALQKKNFSLNQYQTKKSFPYTSSLKKNDAHKSLKFFEEVFIRFHFLFKGNKFEIFQNYTPL